MRTFLIAALVSLSAAACGPKTSVRWVVWGEGATWDTQSITRTDSARYEVLTRVRSLPGIPPGGSWDPRVELHCGLRLARYRSRDLVDSTGTVVFSRGGSHDWQEVEPYTFFEPLLLQVCDAGTSRRLPITGVPSH